MARRPYLVIDHGRTWKSFLGTERQNSSRLSRGGFTPTDTMN